MSENETQQNSTEELMILHTALCFYNTKLRKEITCVPLLKESNEDKAIILENTQATQERVSKLITKTFNQILI